MPAHRKPPPSPLKTGITHTAIALLTFAGLSAAGVFAIQTLGNAEHATPKRTVGLFTAAPVGPLPLKERMSETSGFNEHQVSGPDTHEDEHTPNLGVADQLECPQWCRGGQIRARSASQTLYLKCQARL